MNNETEEPERIWAWPADATGRWSEQLTGRFGTAKPSKKSVPYVPEALSDAKDKRIEELEAHNRELHMKVIASDSQAQMAYEEQERLEAKMAAAMETLQYYNLEVRTPRKPAPPSKN